MKRIGPAAAAVAIVAVLSGCAAAGASDSSVERRASALVDRALARTQRQHPGCVPGSAVHPSFGLATGAPESSLTELLALFRRPQTAEEGQFSARVARNAKLFPFGGDRLFADATRLVTTPDGTEFVVTVAQSVPDIGATSPSYDACAALRHRRLVRTLHGEPGGVRRRALALDGKLTRRGRFRPTQPNAVGLSRRQADYAEAGGPIDAALLRRDGIWGPERVPHPRRLFGLVPDGITTVVLAYGRRHSQAPVRANVFSIRIPNRVKTPTPDRITWKDADGKTANVVKPDIIYADFERG